MIKKLYTIPFYFDPVLLWLHLCAFSLAATANDDDHIVY